jgi:hypothetical protein
VKRSNLALSIKHKKKTAANLSVFFRFESYDKAQSRYIYSKSALLYQDILRYFEIVLDRPFKFNEVARWLVENNKEFREFYQDSDKHTSVSNRIAARRQRIQSCFDDLLEMDIIETEGMINAERNPKVMTPLYRFTRHAKFMHKLLLYCDSVYAKERTEEELIKHVPSLYEGLEEEIFQPDPRIDPSLPVYRLKEEDSCMMKLSAGICNIFYRVGLFHELIDNILNSLHFIDDGAPDRVYHIFLNLASISPFNRRFSYLGNKKLELLIWYDAFAKLDQMTKDLLLFYWKNSFESQSQLHRKPFEVERFKYRGDQSHTVFEVNCRGQHLTATYVLKTIDAVGMYFDARSILKIECPRCKRKAQVLLEQSDLGRN